ncbi:DUF3169 family protein [Oscillibacter valericigenes]|uniref:DUF3169 family protein n=1 Tax=Oscillibacter valericigenes TaxID=351091 RepID=UPI001F316504|nr:DUF3169 family protein [Oscillibacter valericigenes]MCF2663173.1 DUF3169 family protein [Oscillibacter valericigenes]
MENNTVKKDNRKALPKYLLILFVAAIFGGVLGFAAGWLGHDNLSEVIAAVVADGLIAAAPWALLGTSVVSMVLILWLYRGAKALYTGWDGEDDDVMDRANQKLNWALLLTAAQLVLDMFFFAVAQSAHNMTALWSVLFFLVSIFLLVFAQQKIVDLTRKMNPEKKGSVYDTKFKKKWFESCDEAEQKQIGRAAYKAFNVVSTACPILWGALLLLSYAFNFSLLMPTFIVCFIWLLQQVSYCLECIRLGKRK